MTLRRTYPTADVAERIRRALAPDEPAGLTSRVASATLILELVAPSAASARATLEDLLPCVATAERSQGITTAAPTEADPDE
ncbi:MAG TPA: KEOPS complex subunit Pcc1 [Thermoplasmata archaeon]|nr:KEOPS complex subunit Pcc1 [Thermoplasmata archaeon]